MLDTERPLGIIGQGERDLDRTGVVSMLLFPLASRLGKLVCGGGVLSRQGFGAVAKLCEGGHACHVQRLVMGQLVAEEGPIPIVEASAELLVGDGLWGRRDRDVWQKRATVSAQSDSSA